MAEKALGQRTDFRSLVDHLEGVAIWIVSEPGTFEYVSDGFEDIFGVPASTVIEDPTSLIERIHPADRERVRAAMAQDETEIEAAAYENRIVRPDGTVRWVQTRQFPVEDDEGDFAAVVGVNTDITAQKRREEELEVLNRVVRHDIRNDMNVVLAWAQVLDEHVDAEGRETLERLLAAGEHVVELTDIAREYVEMIATTEPLATGPTSLRSVLEPEVELRRESFPEAEIVVRGEVPAVDVEGTDMLQSVFRNLLTNAAQHNDRAEPHVEIAVTVADDDVLVTVADDGPGIPDDRKAAVFGKGEKALDSPGTGIGLYLVRTIVEQCGGEVWVEDNDPRGAVFGVRLPLAR